MFKPTKTILFIFKNIFQTDLNSDHFDEENVIFDNLIVKIFSLYKKAIDMIK